MAALWQIVILSVSAAYSLDDQPTLFQVTSKRSTFLPYVVDWDQITDFNSIADSQIADNKLHILDDNCDVKIFDVVTRTTESFPVGGNACRLESIGNYADNTFPETVALVSGERIEIRNFGTNTTIDVGPLSAGEVGVHFFSTTRDGGAVVVTNKRVLLNGETIYPIAGKDYFKDDSYISSFDMQWYDNAFYRGYELAVGTDFGIAYLSTETLQSETSAQVERWHDWKGSWFDAEPSALHYMSNGDLYIGTKASLTKRTCEYCDYEEPRGKRGKYWRYENSDVPQTSNISHITSIEHENGEVFLVVAAAGGVNVYNSVESRWRWLSSDLYLPGYDSIRTICSGNQVLYVGTHQGLAEITFSDITTLEQKAAWVQEHVADKPYHSRYGLYSEIGLGSYGSPSTGNPGVSDNDALWTSQLAVPTVIRYALTGEETARQFAWNNAEGFELLNNVSGIVGLPARTIREGDPGTDPNWHASPTVPGFSWKGDTSADSLVGHHFFYSVAYKYLAKNADEREKLSFWPVAQLDYLVRNGLKLIDVTGEPTKWGFFDPWKLNYGSNPNERPLYSMEILSYLTAGMAYCEDSGNSTCYDLFESQFLELYTDNGYRENILNPIITSPEERNYSDDEQYFMAILPFFMYCNQIWASYESDLALGHDIIETFKTSIQQYWRYAKRDYGAAYGAVTKLALGTEFKDVQILLRSLQDLPMEQVDWPMDNTERQDFYISEQPDRSHNYGTHTIYPLHHEETGYLKWNNDPYKFKRGGGGTEFPGSVFLMPYWINVLADS